MFLKLGGVHGSVCQPGAEVEVIILEGMHVVPDVLLKDSGVVGQGEGPDEIDGHTCLQGLHWVHPDVDDVCLLGEVSVVLRYEGRGKVIGWMSVSETESDWHGALAA
jgi:hypothetical protein